MEDNFRNVLIILSGIVIGAIFIHGLWTIRKQKNPYKLKASKEKVEPLTRNFDGTGFDQDGVGQVVVKKQPRQQQDDESTYAAESSSYDESPIEQDLENNLANTVDDGSDEHLTKNLDGCLNEQWLDSDAPKNFSKEELGDDLTPTVTQEHLSTAVSEPVYKQPVTNAKPVRPNKQSSRQSIKKSPTDAALKRNQMEINFGDTKIKDDSMTSSPMSDDLESNVADVHDETLQQASSSQESAESQGFQSTRIEKPTIDPQVIIISVVMPPNQQMLGASLLPSLLTLGLKYGEMNIFHRHQDNAGNGEVTFSLANMMKPGSFDLDSMETFATQGISLFMTLPNAADPFAVFEQMLNAAKQLAQEFNGQILDDKRNVMTQQTEQHYVSKIRDYDRKSRVPVME